MDVSIVVWFQNTFGSGFMDVVFGAFYYLLNPLVTMTLPIIIFYMLDKRLAYRVGIFYGISTFFCGTFKVLFNRPRPFNARPDLVKPRIEELTSSASMPSGHAMGAVALLYPAARKYGYDTRRIWVIILAAFVTLMVGLSRVYMGGHYLTDILAGYGFGIVFTFLLELGMVKLKDKFYLFALALIPVMILIICLLPDADASGVGMAFSIAMLVGGYLEQRFVKLNTDVKWWKRLIMTLIAINGAYILGLFAVTEIFKAIHGYAVNEATDMGIKTAGYFTMFFVANAWAYIACPFIFKYAPKLFNKLFKKNPDPTPAEATQAEE